MLEKLPESLGHALLNQRAGMEQVVYNTLFRQRQTTRIDVYSSAFVFNARLPTKYTADGAGMSPPLSWRAIPASTTSLALIVEDADAPTPHPLVHAIVVNIAGGDGSMQEGDLDSPDHAGVGLLTGVNSYLMRSWLPPDPPRGHGEHRYVFQIYALKDAPPFSAAPGRGELVKVILEYAIGSGCSVGTYEREGTEPAPIGDLGDMGISPDSPLVA